MFTVAILLFICKGRLFDCLQVFHHIQDWAGFCYVDRRCFWNSRRWCKAGFQSHAWILLNIVLLKSKKRQNPFVSEVRRTGVHRIIDCFLVMWILTKTKQDSFLHWHWFTLSCWLKMGMVHAAVQVTFLSIKTEQKCAKFDSLSSQLNHADYLHDACITHPPVATMNSSRVYLWQLGEPGYWQIFLWTQDCSNPYVSLVIG